MAASYLSIARVLAKGTAAILVLTSGSEAFAQSAAEVPASAPDAPRQGAVLDEVIVTARRKEERTQDVPISITAFSGERLLQQGITSTQSLQASVPSLVVGPNGQGSRDVESPTIRGQGATFQASPGVAVYFAEAPLVSALTLSTQGGPGNYLDLANLQVLKGPQGTLFGRNTTGGAILLEPNRPTENFEGYVNVQAGNYADREFQAVLNAPLIEDRLLVRFAGEIAQRDGYTRDITFNKDRDDKDNWAVRLGVTWRPVDGFQNYLVMSTAKSETNGTGIVGRGFNLLGLQLYQACGNAFSPPCSAYQDLAAAQDARGPRTIALSADVYQRTETSSVTDIVDWDLTDALRLRNVANYAELQSFYIYDGDGSVASQNDVNPFRGRTVPRDDVRQYSEELQLQGRAWQDDLTYIVGVFYYKNEPNGLQAAGSSNVCGLGLGPLCLKWPQDTSPGNQNPFNNISNYGVTNESYAAYAQGTYDFGGMSDSLKGLRLTLGYRYTWDRIDGFATSYNPDPPGWLGANGVDDPQAAVCAATGLFTDNPLTDCLSRGKLRSSAPTWTVGLDYNLTDAILLYARVSEGYKAGGFNTYAVRPETLTFGPEEVRAYEAGFKSDFDVSDAPARLNVNLFQLDYSAIQRAAGDTHGASSGAQVLSSASATIRGVELEATIRPIANLELGLNYSYIDAQYDKFPFVVPGPFPHQDCTGAFIPGGATADMSCLPMQYLSPNILSTYVRIGFTDDLSLFVNYSWTDEQHTEALVLEQNQPGERLEAYGLVNATLEWKNIAGVPVDVSVFGTNLADKEYRISNTDVYQVGSLLSWGTIYGEPRMYGVRARYNWGR
jgi:iron complex outermembrane receptor protein